MGANGQLSMPLWFGLICKSIVRKVVVSYKIRRKPSHFGVLVREWIARELVG